MTETTHSQEPSEQLSGQESKDLPPTAGSPDNSGTLKLRDSAAALSATPPAAPPETGSAGRLQIRAILTTLFSVIIVLGLGYTTLPYWRDRLPPAVWGHLSGAALVSDALQQKNRELNAHITDVTTKLQAKETDLSSSAIQIAAMANQANDLNARLAASKEIMAKLRTANVEGAGAATEITSLKSRIAVLDQLLAAEKEARSAADAATQKANGLAAKRTEAADKLAATIDQATSRIYGLEENLSTARKAAVLAGKAGAIVLATRKLREALVSAAPFLTEMMALKDAAGETPAVAALLTTIEPMANVGAATPGDLFARLPAAIAASVAADRQPKSGSWIDRTMAKLTGFVTVRRIDGKGTDADAILARAEIAAQRGNLAATVKEISALVGPGGEVTASWLKAAQARLTVDHAQISLGKIMLLGGARDPS